MKAPLTIIKTAKMLTLTLPNHSYPARACLFITATDLKCLIQISDHNESDQWPWSASITQESYQARLKVWSFTVWQHASISSLTPCSGCLQHILMVAQTCCWRRARIKITIVIIVQGCGVKKDGRLFSHTDHSQPLVETRPTQPWSQHVCCVRMSFI